MHDCNFSIAVAIDCIRLACLIGQFDYGVGNRIHTEKFKHERLARSSLTKEECIHLYLVHGTAVGVVSRVQNDIVMQMHSSNQLEMFQLFHNAYDTIGKRRERWIYGRVGRVNGGTAFAPLANALNHGGNI